MPQTQDKISWFSVSLQGPHGWTEGSKMVPQGPEREIERLRGARASVGTSEPQTGGEDCGMGEEKRRSFTGLVRQGGAGTGT